MSLFQAIMTVALYEAKILMRSWFFRIFAALFLVLIGLFDWVFFVWERSASWVFMGMPAGLPYADLLLLNVLQAIVAIFLASDFLKYDRKLDSTDVIYIRSMTNASYVLGKVLGVLGVFALLNIATLIIAAVMNVFFTDMPFIAAAYLIYPLLISLPTLVFVFGLTFLLMVLVRSQALVFVILLGYIAASLFFLHDNLYNLLDYTAFSQPMAWSDFIGMGDITTTLYQRGFYLLAGVGLTLATVLFLRRLPQNKPVGVICAIGAILCLGGAGLTGFRYVHSFEESKAVRAGMIGLTERYAGLPAVSVSDERIVLTHEGKNISAGATLVFSNTTDGPIERYRFSLNPGLAVTEVSRGETALPFERETHLLLVSPEKPLEPGISDSITVTYAGAIDEAACYLDMDDSTRFSPNSIALFTASKQYAIIRPDYLLLTPESGWYPSAALPATPGMSVGDAQDFIRFHIELTTDDDLNALSAGVRDSLGDGRYVFAPETPLPRIHLTAGRYEKMALSADSVEFALYLLRGHDFFSQYFPDIGENLPDILKGFLHGMENRLNLDYPFERLALVETPLQFKAYKRPWIASPEVIQPEQVLLPEKGLFLQGIDFRRTNYFMSQGMQRSGRGQNPEDMQRNMLNQFLNQTLSGGNTSGRQARVFRSSTGQGFSLQRMAFSLLATMGLGQEYSIFPMFYSLPGNLYSTRWPILDLALDNYLRKRLESPMGGFFNMMMGTSPEDEASTVLTKYSLDEVLKNPEYSTRRGDILSAKSKYLFSAVESRTGTKAFQQFLKEFLESHRFAGVPAEEFLNSLKAKFNLDLGPELDNWLKETKVAAFLFGAAECREVLDENKTRYQVTLEVSNTGEGDGLLGLSARSEERGPRDGGFGISASGSMEIHLFNVPSGQSRQLFILLDEAPNVLSVDTYISRNLPTSLTFRLNKPVEDHAAAPFQGEKPIPDQVRLDEIGTIIVDNEDAEFKTLQREGEGKLKSLIASRNNGNGNGTESYQGIYFWNPPRHWTPTTNTDFFGLYRHSARYIKAGKGENRVSWTAQIPKSGQYGVYVYITEFDMPWMRRGRGGPGGRGGGDFNMVDDFHFSVHHDDGAEDIVLDVSAENTGWVLLKDFYFSAGPAMVELSDRSKGRIVYADAVKWVEQR